MNNNKTPLDVNAPLSREALYELVWSEPMLKVAARFGLSSSYMARVCSALNVPRPAAGYWGKAAVGRAPEVPPLPAARPGDQLTWKKGETVAIVSRPTRVRQSAPPRARALEKRDDTRASMPQEQKSTEHHLVSGAKQFFEKGRFSHDLGYLRPDKKTLVDVIVTAATLDRALNFASLLFQAFEDRQHRVLFARDYGENQRVEPDVLEQPPGPLVSYTNLWSPYYPTVVFIGGARIGLRIVEMAEEVLARYVNGKYIRDSEYKPPKRRLGYDSTWTTKRSFTTGRLRLEAYSAFRGTEWKRRWDEKSQSLELQVEQIVAVLEKSASAVSLLVEEAERKREAEHREWEAQRAEWRRKEEQRRLEEAN
jgi:hypothetical protein